MSALMYHSVDSQPETGEANVSLRVKKLPRYGKLVSLCFIKWHNWGGDREGQLPPGSAR